MIQQRLWNILLSNYGLNHKLLKISNDAKFELPLAEIILPAYVRGGARLYLKLSHSVASICILGFEILSKGTFWDKKDNRKQYKLICPIMGSKKFATQYLILSLVPPSIY